MSSDAFLTPHCDQLFGRYIFGIDEVGLGPLAGPLVIVCCAVDIHHPPDILVKDSKKLTEKQREKLFDQVLWSPHVFWGCGIISAQELDALGISDALKKGVDMAFQHCTPPFLPDHILVDGNRDFQLEYPCTSIIKGDSCHYTIALASVIAKVLRDRWMRQLDILYPEFGFAKHKGYGTKAHIDKILQGNICPHHRKSFDPIKNYLQSYNYL